MRARSLLSTAAVAASMMALQAAEPAPTPSVHVRSTPENVVLGVFPIDRAPVA
jgi:hypothetical protein